MFERFTQRAREVVIVSQAEAQRLGGRPVGGEHLLLGLLADPDSPAVRLLRGADVEPDALRRDLEEQVPRGPLGLDRADTAALREIGIDTDAIEASLAEALGREAFAPPAPPRPRGLFGLGRRRVSVRFSPQAKKVLELSLREALHLKHRHIGTEHILLGLLREGNGPAAAVLARAGLDLPGLRRQVLEALRADAA